MRRLPTIVIGFACLLTFPAIARAQATITGTVRDTSNAVLPGVTVEATGPALLALRSVVTDGGGLYRIIDLPPGAYTVSYTLAGFTRVVREGVMVAGSGAVTVSVEMRVGTLAESITVISETPVVDVQTTRREIVLSNDIIQSLPATRSYGALLNAIPGMTVGGTISAQTTPEMTLFTARGGNINEGRMTVDGMNVAAAFNGGGVSSLTYDTANAEEIQIRISGGLGDSETGGPSMNLIPRSGGNRFAGTAFWSGAGDWSRGENIDDYLRSIGIARGPALVKSYDVNGSYGGPIKRDKLWFFGSARTFSTARANEGAFANGYAFDASRWNYLRDDNVEARTVQSRDTYSIRLTAQLNKRDRVSFSQEQQYRCEGSPLKEGTNGCHTREANWIGGGSIFTSPESAVAYIDFPYRVTQATWTSPITNRLLLEAGFSRFAYQYAGFGVVPPDGIMDLIPVTEQSAIEGHRANFTYRGLSTHADNVANPNNWRASAAYVTGAHNIKVGYQGAYQRSDTTTRVNQSQLAYRFNNGVPNQFTFRLPTWLTANRTAQHSLYAQDQWTHKRLTLQGAVRYDHAYSFSPAEHNGTTEVSRFNAQPITFERTVSVNGYDDITPRFGMAYDLRGNGKTALKMNVGRYLDAATNDSNYTRNNPANRIVTSVNRSWVDGNGNFVVDCDILNPTQQANPGGDTCGALTGNSLNFANVGAGTQVNPAILDGRGIRPYDWQFGLSIQQELRPRVSVEVGYNRRWWGNNFVTDNLQRGPQDYDTWSFTAPVDARLPNGGGYTITQYVVTQAASNRGAQNYVTFETDFGPARTDYWHGVDITGNARLRNGLVFQGGTSTGRGIEDTCATVIDNPDRRGCRDVEAVRTTFRGLASYTIPKVDIRVSASMRSLPAPQLSANYNIPNSVVRQLLGRLPPGALANGNTTVNLLLTGEKYADSRTTQVDMRFAKILRFRGTRTDLGVDLYNLFNSNHAVGYDGTYDYTPAAGLGPGGEWLRPTTIVQPRFVRLNVTVSF